METNKPTLDQRPPSTKKGVNPIDEFDLVLTELETEQRQKQDETLEPQKRKKQIQEEIIDTTAREAQTFEQLSKTGSYEELHNINFTMFITAIIEELNNALPHHVAKTLDDLSQIESKLAQYDKLSDTVKQDERLLHVVNRLHTQAVNHMRTLALFLHEQFKQLHERTTFEHTTTDQSIREILDSPLFTADIRQEQETYEEYKDRIIQKIIDETVKDMQTAVTQRVDEDKQNPKEKEKIADITHASMTLLAEEKMRNIITIIENACNTEDERFSAFHYLQRHIQYMKVAVNTIIDTEKNPSNPTRQVCVLHIPQFKEDQPLPSWVLQCAKELNELRIAKKILLLPTKTQKTDLGENITLDQALRARTNESAFDKKIQASIEFSDTTDTSDTVLVTKFESAQDVKKYEIGDIPAHVTLNMPFVLRILATRNLLQKQKFYTGISQETINALDSILSTISIDFPRVDNLQFYSDNFLRFSREEEQAIRQWQEEIARHIHTTRPTSEEEKNRIIANSIDDKGILTINTLDQAIRIINILRATTREALALQNNQRQNITTETNTPRDNQDQKFKEEEEEKKEKMNTEELQRTITNLTTQLEDTRQELEDTQKNTRILSEREQEHAANLSEKIQKITEDITKLISTIETKIDLIADKKGLFGVEKTKRLALEELLKYVTIYLKEI